MAAARQLAAEQLAGPLPRRWRHVLAVAATANRIAEVVELDATVLVCAAWLHDIGYAPSLTDTGFHPLDGARFLRRSGWLDEVCDLVAHHSCARVEANERGVGRHLAMEFIDWPGPERDALWTADATTGPDGRRLDPRRTRTRGRAALRHRPSGRAVHAAHRSRARRRDQPHPITR